jgi:hypothetical protein
VEEDASVYKLVGPLLVKQDLVEARANVGKRLEFITSERCGAPLCLPNALGVALPLPAHNSCPHNTARGWTTS